MKTISRPGAKWLSIAAALFMVLTFMQPAAFAEAPSDISGHWAEGTVSKWVEEGKASGYPDGTFKPENPISRAEFMALVNNAFGFTQAGQLTFTDVPQGIWYESVVAKAQAAGYISGYPDGTVKPEASISRQEVAVIISNIKNLKGIPSVVNDFGDGVSVPKWSKSAVGAVVASRFMRGYPDNTFKPANNIKRAEALIALNNAVEAAEALVFDEAGTFGPASGTYTADGDVVIKADGVILRNYIIKGNLVIAEEVGSGTVTLNNIVVEGETFVRGGGTNSIVINGGSYKRITVQQTASGAVRIVAIDVDGVEVVLAEDATGEDIVLEGTFESVIVDADDVVIQTQGETVIDQINVAVNIEGTVLKIEEGTTVGKAVLESAASVEGTGTIQEAEIKADGTTFEKAPETQTVDEGIEEPVVTEDEPETPPSGGGGGGGSSPVAVTVLNINPSDLSSAASTDRFTGISFTTNAATSQLVMTAVVSPNMGTVGIDRTLTFNQSNATISVGDLLGGIAEGRDSISVGTLREFFGESIRIEGTLSGTGAYASYTACSNPITIQLGTGANAGTSEWATLEFDEVTDTITATILSGKENTYISDIGIYTLLMESAGEIPSYVSTDNIDWKAPASDAAGIKTDILALAGAGKTWDNTATGAVLSDLAGKTIYFKKSGDDTTVYTINIQ